MMKKVFVAYGSGSYLNSLRRIGREARKLHLFHKVILYRESDLPSFIKSSPLMAYKRGGGYWVWKPYIIWKTMQQYPDAIVVYADCGCTLQTNMEEWERWFRLLETYDSVAFRYRLDYDYPWQPMVQRETIDAVWTKKALVDYFDPLLGGCEWIMSGQVWSGLVLSCRNCKAVRMWMDITLMHPELVIDCFGNEIVGQGPAFFEHRHDQSIWSAVCSYWERVDDNTVKVLEETAESDSKAAVLATRIHDVPREPLKTRVIRAIKQTVGDKAYNKMHFWN